MTLAILIIVAYLIAGFFGLVALIMFCNGTKPLASLLIMAAALCVFYLL